MAQMESDAVGGTCVNFGCVPSRAMLAPSEASTTVTHRFTNVPSGLQLTGR